MGNVDKKVQQVIYINKTVSSALKRISLRYDVTISKLAEVILEEGLEDLKKNGGRRIKFD